VNSRSPRRLALAATVATLAAVAPFVLAPDSAAPAQPGPGAQLLDAARRAAQEQDYSGVLEVSWSDTRGEHSSNVSVRSANGVLALGDRPQVIVSGARRFVQGPNGWLSVWSQETQPNLPSPTAKWDLPVRDGPTVAGRPTREVDAIDRHTGRVRERLYLDEVTSLLLRREQLDTRGRTVRAVGFTTIGEPAVGVVVGPVPGGTPQTPSGSTNRQPRVLHEVTAPFHAPRSAGDRFRLVGRYDEDGHTLHLFYSDGLFSVSVFEQKGQLDPTGLPAGAESRTVAGLDVRQYRTPGAVVQVWGSADVVYTTVSDAPLDQLDAVLADVTPPRSTDPVTRVTDFVLGPFSW
jgi:hypothetical protein